MTELSSQQTAARAIDDPTFAQEVLDSGNWPEVADAIRADLADHAGTAEPGSRRLRDPPEPDFVGSDPPEPDFQLRLGDMWGTMSRLNLHNLARGH